MIGIYRAFPRLPLSQLILWGQVVLTVMPLESWVFFGRNYGLQDRAQCTNACMQNLYFLLCLSCGCFSRNVCIAFLLLKFMAQCCSQNYFINITSFYSSVNILNTNIVHSLVCIYLLYTFLHLFLRMRLFY